MNRTRLILLGCFLIVFAAGISSGLLVSHLQRPPRHRDPFEALKLTKEQRQKMGKIWEETMGPLRRDREERMALRKKCDEAIAALIPADKTPEYQKALQDFARGLENLSQKRRQAVEEAIRRTKTEVLTAEQVPKYEEILKKQRSRDGRKGGPPGPPPGDPPAGPDRDQSHAPHRGE